MEGKTILLVEDNPDDVDLILQAFRQNGRLNNIAGVQDGAKPAVFNKFVEAGKLPELYRLIRNETPVAENIKGIGEMKC